MKTTLLTSLLIIAASCHSLLAQEEVTSKTETETHQGISSTVTSYNRGKQKILEKSETSEEISYAIFHNNPVPVTQFFVDKYKDGTIRTTKTTNLYSRIPFDFSVDWIDTDSDGRDDILRLVSTDTSTGKLNTIIEDAFILTREHDLVPMSSSELAEYKTKTEMHKK